MSHSLRDDWRPTATWDMLRLRAVLLKKMRDFFDQRGFLEVETPLLSADTVVDRHIDPFAVSISTGSATAQTHWLQTSPEFAMKRLMAAGGKAIYQITRAFRQAEQGALHNPEFTIVEWYRRGDMLVEGMTLLSDVCHAMLGLGSARRITYRSAFETFAGIDPFRSTNSEIATVVRSQGILPPDSLATDDRDGWLDLLLVSLVEPRLGFDAPVILYDYPPSQAALAIVRDEDPPVAERFELYVRGIELANGYHELADADLLRARFAANNRDRAAQGKPALPETSRLLSAMQSGLPDCSGVALGFDRLVMLATGAKTLDEVTAFPFDRA